MYKKKTNRQKEALAIEKILEINHLIFPYLISSTFFFLFLESYMYIGFLRKFIFLDSRFFLFFSIVSTILSAYSISRYKNIKFSQLESLILDINLLFFVPFVIFYCIMVVSNSIKYSNYVFATFHIQPQNFLQIVWLSLILSIFRLYKFGESSVNIDRSKFNIFASRIVNNVVNKNILVFIIFCIAVTLFAVNFVDNLTQSLNQVVNNDAFIVTHFNFTYDQKMITVWGFYYNYMKFVREHTPDGATIIIPPQDGHWLSSGNEWLDRYFLYPRKLINGEDFNIPKNGYDYVLIAKGEWNDKTIGWGWPKVSIRAEKIWYIDSNTLKISELKTDFDPNNSLNNEAWGLIKIKK